MSWTCGIYDLSKVDPISLRPNNNANASLTNVIGWPSMTSPQSALCFMLEDKRVPFVCTQSNVAPKTCPIAPNIYEFDAASFEALKAM